MPTITNCTINSNSAGYGGGIYCAESSPTLTNCTISANSATWYGSNWSRCGGGIFLGGVSSPTITNCIISKNTAFKYGGGLFCSNGASPVITNCTIGGNGTYLYSGGGIYYESGSLPTVLNSILWEDGPDEIYPVNGSITVTYSDIQGGYTGTGNLDANPQFTGGGDYHLAAGSPCIDKAICSVAPQTDKDGTNRPQGLNCDIRGKSFLC